MAYFLFFIFLFSINMFWLPPKRNIQNANTYTRYLGMCFLLEGEKSGGSAPKSFMMLIRASLSEPLSQGSLDFLYHFTTLVCNLKQLDSSSFLWFFYFKQKAESPAVIFCHLALKVKGVSPGLHLTLPLSPPSCEMDPFLTVWPILPQVWFVCKSPLRASCLHFLLSLCKFLFSIFALAVVWRVIIIEVLGSVIGYEYI